VCARPYTTVGFRSFSANVGEVRPKKTKIITPFTRTDGKRLQIQTNNTDDSTRHVPTTSQNILRAPCETITSICLSSVPRQPIVMTFTSPVWWMLVTRIFLLCRFVKKTTVVVWTRHKRIGVRHKI